MSSEFDFVIKQRATWISTLRHEGLGILSMFVLQVWVFTRIVDSTMVAIGISFLFSTALYYAALHRRKQTVPIMANKETLYLSGEELNIRSIKGVELKKGSILGCRVIIDYDPEWVESIGVNNGDRIKSRTCSLRGLDMDQIQQFISWISDKIADKSYASWDNKGNG